jgi:hypothetical protein
MIVIGFSIPDPDNHRDGTKRQQSNNQIVTLSQLKSVEV